MFILLITLWRNTIITFQRLKVCSGWVYKRKTIDPIMSVLWNSLKKFQLQIGFRLNYLQIFHHPRHLRVLYLL